MPQGWTETPTSTGDALTPSTGAQGRHTLPEVVRGYPLTLTRSQPHRTRHRPRQAAQGADIHPPHTMPAEGAQMPHRARSGASGTAANPPHQDEPQPHGMTRRRCEAYLYEYG